MKYLSLLGWQGSSYQRFIIFGIGLGSITIYFGVSVQITEQVQVCGYFWGVNKCPR